MRTIAMVLTGLSLIAAPTQGQEFEPEDSHEAAAYELIQVMETEEQTRQAAAMMIDNMTTQNPMMAQFKDIFEEFFAEHMAWENMVPHYVHMYSDAYTEEELRQLTAFYRTPLGQKVVETMPELMRRSAELAQQQVAPHLPELQARIQERLTGGG